MSTPIALVTGASRSVGKGVALALGSHGWTVYVTARGAVGADGPLDETAREVTQRGGRGIAVQCDHRDDAQIATLFSRIAGEQGGRLDLLVNNVWAAPKGFAGFTEKFWQRPLSDWDTLIGVGLRAHYVASVHAAQLMVPRGAGLIANISSFGARGHLHSVLYGMSKAGLDKMAADMAVELAGTGVSAVSLWPGLVKNEVMRGFMDRGLDNFQGFPLANAETPEFIGRVIAALAQDPHLAARNGHTLITAEIALDYGITDLDGNQPDSHRSLFGGGPLY
ncbi:SDR family NAD(P)-dependent oxidoreductase [Mycolicibacter arupensis]|jgi:NAD(P)-dependent dehydrogenase (short-subunit alcohol dehydrogenase family)|uniref:Short-chain dehydrogenase n=1 Tax=Mycolicibacter arupensis TaxID=342002 RepID=A0A0F5N2C8_9MYCO|nr:SDR family NAD(P)-dependent oxidoreductase [Mycolicibacter arupensis]KKC01176.1 short-chain dehydrogenase [Mycolicibacter arupensis]MCV7276358.1 SDR family oxidoreductase [Mycolicibacter arupensis]ORA00750.1 short-chain dehydrogenase [Mycolicibacter arupensis]